jgi:SRSO17 transposase
LQQVRIDVIASRNFNGACPIRFDDLFTHVAQRRGFREYLAGLLAPRDRNKTLTALAGAEPVTGPKLPAVQRLQFFLTRSVWDPDLVNERRLELLLASPLTAPHGGGVLVIDDSGDRKDGTAARPRRLLPVDLVEILVENRARTDREVWCCWRYRFQEPH